MLLAALAEVMQQQGFEVFEATHTLLSKVVDVTQGLSVWDVGFQGFATTRKADTRTLKLECRDFRCRCLGLG